MRILEIGPSPTLSKGGMATVIEGIKNSKILNKKFDIDIYESYISGNAVKRIIYSLYAGVRFLSVYKKYDVFHIHTASFGSTFRKKYYADVAKRAGKKVIVHVHGGKYLEFYEGLSDGRKKKVRDFLKSADTVIALSIEWKEKFEKTFGLTNCEAVNNGIDTEAFAEAAGDIEKNRNSFLMLGRIGARKGTYDLITACEKVVEINPAIKVYMAGDGEAEKARETVRAKGLEKNIDVIGWVDGKDKLEVLKKASVLVLPSYHEGLPMSILEGMAAGKTVISTTVGAIPEVIKEENGILIEPGDTDALSDAMLKLSSDTGLLKSMSEKNIEKVRREYSMETMHKKISEIYGKLGG